MGGSEFTHPVVEFRRWLKASGLQMDLEFVLLSFGLDMKVQVLGHWAQDSLLGLLTPKCLIKALFFMNCWRNFLAGSTESLDKTAQAKP